MYDFVNYLLAFLTIYKSVMNSCKNLFRPIQDRIFFPNTHSGIVSRVTIRKRAPRMQKTSKTPFEASHWISQC